MSIKSVQFSDQTPKKEKYRLLVDQIKTVIEDENDLIANLANISALLFESFGHHWVGFYRTIGDELVLGPFQGPPACTRIQLKPAARGVCGAAADQKKTLIVPDVEKFPGHIACSSLSRSEIVVPLVTKLGTELVLDIDSIHSDAFDQDDQEGLEKIISLLKDRHWR
jgi:L-methionine (R)-S-oxide reductase